MAAQTGLLELSVSIGTASFSASGDTSVVLDAYADFKQFVRGDSATEGPVDEAPPRAIEDSPPPEVARQTTLPVKPYLAQYKLSGYKEKAAALLAWSAESGSQREMTLSELETLMKKAGIKASANFSRDVRKAESEGWIDSSGKGAATKFWINGYGEGVVAGWAISEE